MFTLRNWLTNCQTGWLMSVLLLSWLLMWMANTIMLFYFVVCCFFLFLLKNFFTFNDEYFKKCYVIAKIAPVCLCHTQKASIYSPIYATLSLVHSLNSTFHKTFHSFRLIPFAFVNEKNKTKQKKKKNMKNNPFVRICHYHWNGPSLSLVEHHKMLMSIIFPFMLHWTLEH